MMRVLVLVLMLAASQAAAETIAVRSGQHETFSRLVFSIAAGQDWTVGRVPGGYALVMQGEDISFDTSSVFERIQNNRVRGFETSDKTLSITLACDCHADAFLWRADRLVVDIIDGPPPEGSEFERVVAAEQSSTPVVRPAVLPILTEREPAARAQPELLSTFDTRPPLDERVAMAERSILESLARAASQGVLELPSQPLPILDNLPSDTPGSTSGPVLPALTPVTDPMDGVDLPLQGTQGANGPGLVLRTSLDRPDDGAPGPATANGHCLPDSLLNLHDWGDERSFSEQVADKRRALTEEFDSYPTGAIEAMARTYLYFGFGQEARQVLSLDGQRSRERLVLEAMSDVIEGGPVRGTVLADQMDCDGMVVLWAALATGTVEGVGEAGRNAAIMAFRLLPDDLRAHLGTQLARLFLQAGDAATADTVLNVSQLVPGARTAETEVASAAIAEELEGADAAIAALETLAADSTRMTPEGLVQLINLQLSNDKAVSPAVLDLAAALRFESGKTEAARQLAMVEIAAHLSNDAFEAALQIALADDSVLEDTDRDAALSDIYSAKATRQSDAEFLTMAFNALPPGLSPATENAVAGRLISLGFPERARELLASPATQEAMLERRYLRAEAAAAMNNLADVEQALFGMTDPRAAQIRAGVLAATGDYQSALAQDGFVSAAPADPEDAWRAGAWALLEAGDDPLLQSASRAILTTSPQPPDSPTLAMRRSLIDEAEATRTLTQQLLGRFEVTPDQ